MLDLNSIGYNDLLGAIHVEGKWHFCVTYLADWIMDMDAYEGCDPVNPEDYPSGSPERNAHFVFRNNICTVDASNVHEYIDYLLTKEVSKEDIKTIIERDLLAEARPSVMIDFDKHLFVNFTYFTEIEIHNYVSSGWIGVEDNPMEYFPEEVNVWRGYDANIWQDKVMDGTEEDE